MQNVTGKSEIRGGDNINRNAAVQRNKACIRKKTNKYTYMQF